MILSDVLTCTVPPLRVESSLLKNPIPPKSNKELGSDGTRVGQNRGCDRMLRCGAPFFCAGPVPYVITCVHTVPSKFEANPAAR